MPFVQRSTQKVKNLFKLASLYFSSNPSHQLIRAVISNRLSYLGAAALIDLHDRVNEIEKNEREGILIETGCALGGSSLVMTAAKQATRPLYIYDVFGMIPPPSEHDGVDIHERYEIIASGQSGGIKGDKYYGYEENLLEQVKANFSKYGFAPDHHHVHFVQGLYEETLFVDQPVALAHIDCDWHDSVMTCLKGITPHLVSGGILVIDDYLAWSGCRAAVDSYFADKKDKFEFVMKSRLHIIRH